MNFTDRSDNPLSPQQGWALMFYLAAPQYGWDRDDALKMGAYIGSILRTKEKKEERRERNQKTYLATNIPVGLLYSVYRSYKYLSGSEDRNKLDSYAKSAALGYMINGHEGATWGYIYGSMKDMQKLYNRKVNRANDIVVAVAVIGTILSFGKFGLAIKVLEDIASSTLFVQHADPNNSNERSRLDDFCLAAYSLGK